MSGNILFLGNKIFEIPPFFQTRPGDLGKKVHACSIRFSALKLRPSFSPGRSLLRNPTETIATPISTQSSSAHVEERDQERIPKPVSNGFENDCYAGDAGYQRLKLGAPLKLTIMGHFLVPKPLTFKTRLSAKPFL